MELLVVLLFAVPLSSADHQLKYTCTIVEPGQTFTAVVELDGQQILHYDSTNMMMVPDTEWIKKVSVSETKHWNTETESMKKEKEDLKFVLETIMKYFGQQGVHSLSQIHGCQINDKNKKGSGFKWFNYDQKEFLSLNLNATTWIPANAKAQEFLNNENWDSTKVEANSWKEILEGDCINSLQLYVKYSMRHVTHSMQNFYTAVRGIDFPEFTAVGMVDGEQFTYYDSNIERKIPKTEWIKKVVGDDAGYWDTQTQILQSNQDSFKVNMDILMQRFNQTGGVHTFQNMYGCELDEDGTVRGYLQYGYDGEDFLSLDLKTLTWTAANQRAQITKLKWESTGANAHSFKNYMENICMDWIKKYVSYGRETLERRDRPEAELFQKSSSPEVVCHATGFFPKGVTMSWEKDGEEVEEDVEVRETLPNQDGSFQKRIILRVSPKDLQKNKYTCVIQHSSLEKEGLRLEHRDDGVPIGMIVGVVVGLLVLVVGGIVLWKKKNSGYKPASTGSGSDGGDSASDKS